MNLDAASLGILWPAFIAGLLVTATHVPLGMQVLARGIVFVDLAVAQIAGGTSRGPPGLFEYSWLCASSSPLAHVSRRFGKTPENCDLRQGNEKGPG